MDMTRMIGMPDLDGANSLTNGTPTVDALDHLSFLPLITFLNI